ncbi:ATP phosphoribosyltransferase regulatory subunit [Stanieria cyanosphaera PCC 7437]|uniref:ATP phosphoribosyltransferase regulatory subunit n=1 Tax=Stanieria cyanosphaera (strain ATCC 29371 / PCC 7437) TaxID=111780 RepID=K9XVH3_STAC7|nr:ATP phosphoribosyltransferase regulatory subunit [Stanieria cyanosphaera]AFZ36595.1 ATP phosphoribosyltransferase regulatory subunit [Stanieria cyanosphaera PCC 7437]
MIHQPPAGARDLLPLEVAQKGWINDRLQQVFQRWGYQRIVTSTLEWLDTLTAGGAIQPSTVIQLRDESERTLGLRPELTASIARAAVTRMAGNTYPQRLCYRANIFRNPPQNHHGRQLEFYQAGVELLFAGGLLADAEILLLLANCLKDLGVENWQIILGQAELTRSLLALFPESLRKQVRHCLANLDRVTLEKLPLEPTLKEKALFLFDLRGKPKEVLAKIAKWELDQSAQEIVDNLKSLVDLLANSSDFPIPLTLDLSLWQTFDFYTGIVFEVVSFNHNQSYLLGKGGRYDQLLGLYHPQGISSPGIGFALNIEDLHSCLLPTNKLPQQTAASNWLVIAQTPSAASAALNYAQKLRNSEQLVRVELDLGERCPEEIREYARNCRIKKLAWLSSEGEAKIETLG